MDYKLLGDVHGFEAGYAGVRRDFKAAQQENWLPAGDSNGQDAGATSRKPKSWILLRAALDSLDSAALVVIV
jgi:hypothetical protein